MLDYLGEGHDEMLDREAEDGQSERARAIETAPTGYRYCPECGCEVITRWNKTCIWTDGPTLLHPPVIRPGATRTRVSRRRGGAGASGDSTVDPPSRRKLSDHDVRCMRIGWEMGAGQQELADAYGVSRGNVSKIVNRRSYTHVV